MKHLLSLRELSRKEILGIIDLAHKVKKRPSSYSERMKGKTLLMIFAKPSLRTHLSFDIAMTQMGGHAIFYSLSDSVLGKKESIKDFSKVISRYSSIVMARLYAHKEIEELAKNSRVPIINGLTDYYHPCQILGDLLTIKEKFGSFKKVKIAYLGDCNNNVTHSLIIACDKLGIPLTISGPDNKEFLPNREAIGNIKYNYQKDPIKAVRDANVIYTDSWMSYQIPDSQKRRRLEALKPYQINRRIMEASKNAKFMHCLPATRGTEVTDEVMDSSHSIIYDQAENRTYAQKAVILKLMSSKKRKKR